MVGLAVGLLTGRRALVAALGGACIGVVVSLLAGPGPGVIAGGLAGPLLGLAVPRTGGERATALGTRESAERYSMPGSHRSDGAHDDGRPGRATADPTLPPDSEEGLP